MLEIFIPQLINNKLSINTISKEQVEILKESFPSIEIELFTSVFLDGIVLKLPKFNKDLLIYANGAFGKTYFYEYDIIENIAIAHGVSFYTGKVFKKELQNISIYIEEIVGDLQSNKLITNTKKKLIREKIELTFFTLSGVYFSLAELLKKTKSNIDEISTLEGNSEYKAQGSLLQETSKIKQTELESQLTKLEGQAQLFFETISRIFI